MTKMLSFILLISILKTGFAQSLPKIGKDYTLEVCNWNIEWFGKQGFGPKDKYQQFNNIKEVIQASDIDIFAFQEVANVSFFDTLMQQLPNYQYCVSNHSSELKTAFAFKKDMFELIACKNIGIDSQTFFSTGRFPLEIILVPRFDIGLDTLFLINLHLKAHTGNTQEKQNAYQSRKRSCDWLRKYIVENHVNRHLLVLGDWNDDIDESIFNAWPSPMSGLILNPNFKFLTEVFNQRKLGTTTNYPDAIDHQMASIKLMQKWIFDQTYRIELKSLITNYSTTTSDHFPVYSLFNTYTLLAKEVYVNQGDFSNFLPNPCSDKIEFNPEFNPKDLYIVNALGKNMRGSFEVVDHVIHVQDLPVGIYWLIFKNNGFIFKNKIMIVR